VGVLERYVVAAVGENLRNELATCGLNVGGGLTRRNGAEDIAEHISAAAAKTQVVVGVGDEAVGNKISDEFLRACT
jgi:hypothetical protein